MWWKPLMWFDDVRSALGDRLAGRPRTAAGLRVALPGALLLAVAWLLWAWLT